MDGPGVQHPLTPLFQPAAEPSGAASSSSNTRCSIHPRHGRPWRTAPPYTSPPANAFSFKCNKHAAATQLSRQEMFDGIHDPLTHTSSLYGPRHGPPRSPEVKQQVWDTNDRGATSGKPHRPAQWDTRHPCVQSGLDDNNEPELQATTLVTCERSGQQASFYPSQAAGILL
eukprot:774217-Pelagomonas_calceolata.AAC.1